jgi:hypothetical protein
MQRRMVPKLKMHENIPPHIQKQNYEKCIYELEDPIREEALGSNLSPKLGLAKKNSSCKFSQSLVKKCLNWTCISLCHVASPRRGKTRHHWGNKRNKCQAATS